MRHFTDEINIFDGRADNSPDFTAAADNVITKSAHGLAVGDVITVSNSGGALPAGLSANTYYYVITVPDADTFTVSATPGGTVVDITDAGTGTHTYHQEFEGKRILVSDWKSLMLEIHTSGSTTGKIFAKVSIKDDAPTFINPASESNRHTTIMLINLEDATGVEGDDGIVLAGTDIDKSYKVNIDGAKWFTLVTKDFTAGQITAKVKGLHE